MPSAYKQIHVRLVKIIFIVKFDAINIVKIGPVPRIIAEQPI